MSITISIYQKKCPHCGKVYSESQGVPEPKCFDQTIKKFRKCKKTFVDVEAYEWENLKDVEKKNYLITKKYIYPEKSMLFGLKSYMKKALSFKYNPSMLKERWIQESLARTSNPDYRKQLEDCGRRFYGKDIKDDTVVSEISLQDSRIVKMVKEMLERGVTLSPEYDKYVEMVKIIYGNDY